MANSKTSLKVDSYVNEKLLLAGFYYAGDKWFAGAHHDVVKSHPKE
jgi:hypothetical protein